MSTDPYMLSWDDVFYIQDLDNGTLSYRLQVKDNEPHWYNLKLRPNPIYPECRHYCLACGSRYERLVRLVSIYVSTYTTPMDMYEDLRSTTDGGRQTSKIMLGYDDDWWDEYGSYDYSYDDDILKAVEIGKKTKIYSGRYVKVRYTEETDEYSVSGKWADWFEDLVDKVMNFDGHTKQEFYELIQDDCDITCTNMIFANLKAIGCKGIKSMKELNMYRWIDVLVPLINEEWDMSGDDDYGWQL